MLNASEIASVIALSRLKGVNNQMLAAIREHDFSASEFLDMSPSKMGEVCGLAQLPPWQEGDINEAKAVGLNEADFCIRHNVRIISPLLGNYPRRLDILDDAPPLLFMLGDADLDAFHIIGVVGTRRITRLGDSFCRTFVKELGELVAQPLIVSGLAYGTDATAHCAALDNKLPTAAVLAHGLSMIYPAAHKELAKRILTSGGALISQYLSGEHPFKGHFLERNRVIAALSDGVMIVESAIKGGAMNTAHAAFDYSRTVMAMPGRPSDPMSEGCNRLIRRQIAVLTTDALQACHSLGWETSADKTKQQSPTLFKEPDSELLPIYRLLQESQTPLGIDHITIKTGLMPARVSAMLFSLEEDGYVVRLPNNRYTLC